MQYFHRTSLSPDEVMAEADRFFEQHLPSVTTEARVRKFKGAIGEISMKVEAEGGHYTLITIRTDRVGESEADKLSKRFLSVVHSRVRPDYELRGAY